MHISAILTLESSGLAGSGDWVKNRRNLDAMVGRPTHRRPLHRLPSAAPTKPAASMVRRLKGAARIAGRLRTGRSVGASGAIAG